MNFFIKLEKQGLHLQGHQPTEVKWQLTPSERHIFFHGAMFPMALLF